VGVLIARRSKKGFVLLNVSPICSDEGKGQLPENSNVCLVLLGLKGDFKKIILVEL
jgi:hypothetical protein